MTIDSLSHSPRSLADLEAWLDSQEARVAGLIDDAMSTLVAQTVASYLGLQAAGDDGVFGRLIGRWRLFVADSLAPALRDLHLAGAWSMWQAAPTAGISDVMAEAWVSISTESATSYMAGATNRLSNTGDQLWSRVRDLAVRGLAQGQGAEPLTQAIHRAVDVTEFRANTIARTETVGAYVNGDRAGAVALGSHGPREHYWVAARDARVRDSHKRANRQTRGFLEPFDVGGIRMMHPHDRGAPAREVVNCRCVEAHLYAGDRRPDGSTVPD